MTDFICKSCGFENIQEKQYYYCKYCNLKFKYKKSHFTHETYKCKLKNQYYSTTVVEGLKEIVKERNLQDELERCKKQMKKLKTIIMIQQNSITKLLQQVTDGKLTE